MNGMSQNIQWFPGHMTKTLRLMESELRNVDIIIELLDARIPFSSKNPAFAGMEKLKRTVLLLNKSDLADPEVTQEWVEYYGNLGHIALPFVSKEQDSKRKLFSILDSLKDEVFGTRTGRGMTGLKLRAMVIGIPNAGKSTFINLVSNSSAARVEDRPGITRGKQWISAGGIELLDMPGVLWPKFDTSRVAYNLAFCGAISDKVVDTVDLALSLLNEIKDTRKSAVEERYKLSYDSISASELMTAIGLRRGMLISKGEVDLNRVSIMLLDELRGKKLGPVSFEYVSKIEEYLNDQ